MEDNESFAGFIVDVDQHSFKERATAFRRKGVFDRELGDLVIKVCAHILQVPIIPVK